MTMSNIFTGILLNELSTDKLAKYKTAASADATKSDQEGDFKRGDKRFSGIVKATNKQFSNDAKKVKLPEAGAQSALNQAGDAASMAQTALTPAMAAQGIGAGAKALGKTGVATGALKVAGNLGGRLIPGVGAAVSGVSAANRARLGDYTGSAIDAAGGGASFIPGLGTVGSLLGLGTNLVRDRYNTGNWFPDDEQMRKAYSKEPAAPAAKSATPAPTAAVPAAPAAKSATPAPTAAPAAPAAAAAAKSAAAPAANTTGSWQEIYNLNKTIIGANPNVIKPGQKLKLPNGTVYTVKPGDTLSKIAAQSLQESIYMQYDNAPSAIMYGLLEASQQSASIDTPSGRAMSPLEWQASLSNNPAAVAGAASSRIRPASAASSRIRPGVGADHVDSTVTSNTGDNMSKAKQSAEQFLGRRISNDEWDLLLRAVTAEASGNTKEQAWVMGVILNRARSGRWGSSINKVLYAPSQFQAVTGTKYNRNPSSNFTRGPNASQLASIVKGAIEILPNVDQSVMNFTAANSAAYGRGTNINFRNRLSAKAGSQQIGQTIFGTA